MKLDIRAAFAAIFKYGVFRTNKDQNITLTSPPSTENMWSRAIGFQDKTGSRIGDIENIHTTDGKSGLAFGTARVINGNTVYNWLTSYIDSQGNRSWGVTESAAFRSGIGAYSSAAAPTLTHNSILIYTTPYTSIGSVAAGSYKASSISCPTHSGWKARCLVGWNFDNQTSSQTGETGMFLNRAFVSQDEQKVYYTVRNPLSSAVNTSVRFFILYTKNS